jgi:PhnB protein
MPVTLNPYLNFAGKTREAMEFYKSVLGGELHLSTFGESDPSAEPARADLIMHADLQGPGDLRLMGADTSDGTEHRPGNNFSLSLSGEDESVLRGYFDKLAAGGTTTMPLEKAPWGDTFGMCIDKFGVTWLVNITAPAAVTAG